MNIVLFIKQNSFFHYIYKRLISIVEIVPYYLFQEFLHDEKSGVNPKPKLDGLEVGFLETLDMKTISESPEVNQSEDFLQGRLANGCLCLGIKHNGAIAAYTWCNLRKCHYQDTLNFSLKDDEAYLFDARTFKAYRGKNLAPYLRNQLYKHLAQMGRTKFYSASSLFNTSAIKFKKKLKARPFKLYLGIILFKKYRWHILIKDYGQIHRY